MRPGTGTGPRARPERSPSPSSRAGSRRCTASELAAPVVSAAIEATTARLVTLVCPHELGVPAPRLRRREAAPGTTAVEVRRFAPGGETVDVIEWDDAAQPGTFRRVEGA